MSLNSGKSKLSFIVLFFSLIPIILSSCFSYRPINATQSVGGLKASDFEVGHVYRVKLQGVSKPLDIKVHQVNDSLISVIDQRIKKVIYLKYIETAQPGKFSFLKTSLVVGLCTVPIGLIWMGEWTEDFATSWY